MSNKTQFWGVKYLEKNICIIWHHFSEVIIFSGFPNVIFFYLILIYLVIEEKNLTKNIQSYERGRFFIFVIGVKIQEIHIYVISLKMIK